MDAEIEKKILFVRKLCRQFHSEVFTILPSFFDEKFDCQFFVGEYQVCVRFLRTNMTTKFWIMQSKMLNYFRNWQKDYEVSPSLVSSKILFGDPFRIWMHDSAGISRLAESAICCFCNSLEKMLLDKNEIWFQKFLDVGDDGVFFGGYSPFVLEAGSSLEENLVRLDLLDVNEKERIEEDEK